MGGFLKYWREVLAYTAIIATIAGLGFGVGTAVSGGKQGVLEERNKELEERNKELGGEISSLESQKGNLVVALSTCQANSSLPLTSEPSGAHGGTTGLSITVLKGDTGEIRGEMSISVPAITVAYNPFRYVVSASVGGPGQRNVQASALNIGEHINFGAYEVRLLSADLTKARFGIQKIAQASSQQP